MSASLAIVALVALWSAVDVVLGACERFLYFRHQADCIYCCGRPYWTERPRFYEHDYRSRRTWQRMELFFRIAFTVLAAMLISSVSAAWSLS